MSRLSPRGLLPQRRADPAHRLLAGAGVDADAIELVAEIGRLSHRLGEHAGETADQRRAARAAKRPADRIDILADKPRGG